MGWLPVSGQDYISDAPDKSIYSIYRSNTLVVEVEGIWNNDEDGKHLAFLYGTDVIAGDTILAKNGKSYIVKFTDTDEFDNEPQIIKAYY